MPRAISISELHKAQYVQTSVSRSALVSAKVYNKINDWTTLSVEQLYEVADTLDGQVSEMKGAARLMRELAKAAELA